MLGRKGLRSCGIGSATYVPRYVPTYCAWLQRYLPRYGYIRSTLAADAGRWVDWRLSSSARRFLIILALPHSRILAFSTRSCPATVLRPSFPTRGKCIVSSVTSHKSHKSHKSYRSHQLLGPALLGLSRHAPTAPHPVTHSLSALGMATRVAPSG